MSLAWVIGAGGLLGQALVRSLHSMQIHLYTFPEPLAWRSFQQLRLQLAQAATDFVLRASQTQDQRACIFWAAGIGTMDSQAEEMALETAALRCLLQALEWAVRHAQCKEPGMIRICLASSAGALYAGVSEPYVIDDHTPVAPTTAYAHAKLEQEALLQAAVQRTPQLASLSCRISTLYGHRRPNADGDKGLIAHLASALLHRHPVHIYVPLDTMRDYIAADDAAVRMIMACRILATRPMQTMTKCLIASGVSTSISEILHLFRQIGGRKPLVVTSVSWKRDLYISCIRFQPSMWLEQACHPHPRTVAAGISDVLRERLGEH